MMKENKTAYLILMIASAVVTVGTLIAVILVRHDWLIARKLLLFDIIFLAAGALPLLKPEWSTNNRLRRIDGRWKIEKYQVYPNLFLGIVIFAAVVVTGLGMMFE